MAGRLSVGFTSSAVGERSCRLCLGRQRVRMHLANSQVSRQFRSKRISHVRNGVYRTGRRSSWWRVAAEEAAQEVVSETDEEEKDGEDEEQAETENGREEAVEEPAGPAAEILSKAQEAIDSGNVDSEFLESLMPDMESLACTLSDAAASAEAKATALEAEADSLKTQYLRLNADFDNFRKRTATEKVQLKESAVCDVVMKLVPLIDNFELARTQVKCETEGEENIKNSYQGLYKQMVDAFQSLGVEAVESVGKPFDPEMHEAMLRAPNDDVPDGTVLEEFRRGFQMNGKLLRAALVKVSFSDAPAAPAEPSSDESEDSSEQEENTESEEETTE